MSQGRPAVYQWCGYRALLVGSSSCARQFSFGGQKLDTIRVQEGPSRLEHGREQPIHSTHQSVGSRRRRRSGLFGRESLRGVEHPRLVPQVQGVRGSNPLSSTESRVEFPRYRGILRASRMSSVAASQSPLAPPNLFLHFHGHVRRGKCQIRLGSSPNRRRQQTSIPWEFDSPVDPPPKPTTSGTRPKRPQLRPRSPPAAARRPCPYRTAARTSPRRSRPPPAARPRTPTAARGRRCRRTGPARSNGPGSRRCC